MFFLLYLQRLTQHSASGSYSVNKSEIKTSNLFTVKKILILLLFTTQLLSQIKVKDLPTTATGTTGDFIIKDDAAGTSGSTKKISVANFLNVYNPIAASSGTQNYLPKWNNSGGTTLGNSLIFDNGTNVGIGTTSPLFNFDVVGIFRARTNVVSGVPSVTNGQFSLYNSSNGNAFQMRAPANNGYTINWPANQGAANTLLSNDGSGGLSWAAETSGISGLTATYFPIASGATGLTNSAFKQTSDKFIDNSTGSYIDFADGVVSSSISLNSGGAGVYIPGDNLQLGKGLTYIGESDFWNTSNNNYIGLKAGVTTTNGTVFTLPIAKPSTTQVMTSTSAGQLGFSTLAGLGAGTVTSIATSYGLSGGTITSTGTLKVDTTSGTGSAKLATEYWVSQNTGVGTITGSGTTNFLPLFTGSTALGNSYLSQNTTSVKIANGKKIVGATATGNSINMNSGGTSLTLTGGSLNDSIQIGDANGGITLFSSSGQVTMDNAIVSQGQLSLGTASNNGGDLVFNNSSNNNTISIISQATAASITYKLPIASPTTGQVLSSTNTGIWSWVTPVSSSGFVPYTGATSNLDLNAKGFSNVANIGIGVSTPTTELQVNSVNQTGTRGVSLYQNSTYTPPLIKSFKSKGTYASPTTLTSTDSLLNISVTGYDGSAYSVAGSLNFYVDGTVSSGIVPGKLELKTTNASGTKIAGLLIDHSQNVTLAGTANNVGTVTTGTWNGSKISEIYGGTNQSTYTPGDMLQATASNTLGKIPSVSSGSYLRSAGTSTANVWSTLKLPNSATANYIPYATSSNTWGENSLLSFDGTIFTANALKSNASGLYVGSSAATSTIPLNLSVSQNSDYVIQLQNTNAGNANRTYMQFSNGTHSAQITMCGAGYTTSGTNIQDGMNLYTNGAGGWGLQAGSTAGTANIAFYTNGSTLRGQVSNGGQWAIGSQTPTAWLHIAAGTATASQAPLKFTSGTNLATTEAGAIEYNGTHLYFTATNAGTRYQLDQQGVSNYSHNISAPTTGSTVTLTDNQYNIINPSGALLALTLNLPSSPANNDVVYIKYTQNITTVTYANGTVVDGITAPTAGGLVVLTYDSGTTSWY